MPNLSKRAIRILRRIKRHILEEPKRYNQSVEIVLQKDVEKKRAYIGDGVAEFQQFARCGTMGCIAGWICILYARDKQYTSNVIAEAREILELSPQQAWRLFDSVQPYRAEVEVNLEWPVKFKRMYVNARGPAERARVAAARIEHFIATDGEE